MTGIIVFFENFVNPFSNGLTGNILPVTKVAFIKSFVGDSKGGGFSKEPPLAVGDIKIKNIILILLKNDPVSSKIAVCF
jgi:hypothetical protein